MASDSKRFAVIAPSTTRPHSRSTVRDKGLTPPKFVEHPPKTLDDQLEFKVTKLAGAVRWSTSAFESMTSATTGIALRLDGMPEDRLVYVSLLPELLMDSGVIDNGKPVPYEQMTQRLRNEILSLSAGFSVNPRRTGMNW